MAPPAKILDSMLPELSRRRARGEHLEDLARELGLRDTRQLRARLDTFDGVKPPRAQAAERTRQGRPAGGRKRGAPAKRRVVAKAPPARRRAAPAPALALPVADVAPAPGHPLAPKHLVELGARLAVAPLAQQAQLVGGLPLVARLRQALAAALASHPRAARDVSVALRAMVV